MNTHRSLNQYFEQADPATLNTCDTEAIHLSGQIQNFGALLVVDPQSERVVGASDSAPRLLGLDMALILDVPLSDIDPELARQSREAVAQTRILHEVLEYEVTRDGISHDTITHFHDGRRIIEFVPNSSATPKVVKANMRTCSKACAQIIHADHFNDALQVAVDAARQIADVSRAKLYRFQPDWSGEVIAESNDGALPSYLGLCFPAGDIPKQVREIMTMVPYRAIGNASDETVPIRTISTETRQLDLTWSVLRSVSRMHTAYLRNIEVGAAFSLSLMYQDKLWGMIALHNKTPAIIPFDSWSLLQEIGTALMLRYAQQQRNDSASMVSRLRKIENGFASALRKEGDVENVISSLVPVLREFLGADGFAFQFGSNLHLSGRTPPKSFIHALIKWAIKQREVSDQYQSIALHREWEPAKAHMDTCCGVLIQPIVVHRVCQLIWFRGPITRTVSWAGKPDDKSDRFILGPRKSFARWVSQHEDQSAPWGEDQLESAREIFKEFLDIIASQMLLKEENRSLRQFAACAAHDLRAPLLGLNTALDWMSEDNFDPESLRLTHAIAQKSSRRMADLTEGLLELAVLGEQELELRPIELAKVLEDVSHLLTVQIRQSTAVVEIGTIPPVSGSERLLLRLFLNMVSNAIKYRSMDRSPVIRITGETAESGMVKVVVTDNGMGIDAEFADRIFQPLMRLHSKDKIEGSGLGLTICQRIVEAHGGTIHLDTTYRGEGARFILSLPSSAAAMAA